jgi:hypothetical protein
LGLTPDDFREPYSCSLFECSSLVSGKGAGTP